MDGGRGAGCALRQGAERQGAERQRCRADVRRERREGVPAVGMVVREERDQVSLLLCFLHLREDEL